MAYDNIKLEKGLYATKDGFTKSLEKLDPSENYIGTELEGLDAYQRQLKRYDIKVSGNDSDRVEKFFSTSNSAALFPEYISRAVKTGIEQSGELSKLIASTTKIDSLDYRTVEITDSGENLGLAVVGEGAAIPEAVIKTKSSLTKLTKRGRMLVSSYEAVKYQKLDLFTVLLSQIGASIARDEIEDACSILSSAGGAAVEKVSAGGLAYADLVKFWNAFSPYNMNTLICSGDTLEKILNISEFRDSNAGLTFHATGSLITPLGAEIVREDSAAADKIIGIDRRYALEKVQASEVATDFDRIIDRQLERAAVTEISGFSVIFKDAVKYMAG